MEKDQITVTLTLEEYVELRSEKAKYEEHLREDAEGRKCAREEGARNIDVALVWLDSLVKYLTNLASTSKPPRRTGDFGG